MLEENPHLDPVDRKRLEELEQTKSSAMGMNFGIAKECETFTGQLERRRRELVKELTDIEIALGSIYKNPDLLKNSEDLERINRLRGYFNGPIA